MNLKKLRNQLDKLDDKIIPLLEKRLALAKETKKHKKKIHDKNREEEILTKIKSKYIQEIYKAIFKSSKKIQKETTPSF
jgi:shikimate dehydrogenase